MNTLPIILRARALARRLAGAAAPSAPEEIAAQAAELAEDAWAGRRQDRDQLDEELAREGLGMIAAGTALLVLARLRQTGAYQPAEG